MSPEFNCIEIRIAPRILKSESDPPRSDNKVIKDVKRPTQNQVTGFYLSVFLLALSQFGTYSSHYGKLKE